MSLCHECGASVEPGDRFCGACGTSIGSDDSAGDPLVGRIIAEAYTLQELVGVGGMGRVYRAEQRTLGRTVAVKLIHPHLLSDPSNITRFYTEAKASSRLNHPNSVSVIDFGRTDDGLHYLVMEFLRGEDLGLLIEKQGALSTAQICDVLFGVLAALGEAHALRVVHRDLKPENILLSRLRSGRDLVKVVDFGLATILEGADSSVSTPGMVAGTPDYMSPEQASGKVVDGRSDLYSLGAVLFQMLTGDVPFEAQSPIEVAAKHITDPVPDPQTRSPQQTLSPALIAVTKRVMQKDPDARFQTAEEMEHAVRQAADELRSQGEHTVSCERCGECNAAQARFCGGCGARLASPQSAPPNTYSSPPRRSLYPVAQEGAPLIGRSALIEEITALIESAPQVQRWISMAGEIGSGKTRLLNELAGRREQVGEWVIGAAPHPSGVLVPYAAVRTVLCSAAGLAPDADLAGIAAEAALGADPLHQAGLRELQQPQGLGGGRGRAGAVCYALAATLAQGLKAQGKDAITLTVDDYDRCDRLSRQVFARLTEEGTCKHRIVLITTQTRAVSESESATAVEVEGISARISSGANKQDDNAPALFLPLYLEQLSALGLRSTNELRRSRLADLIAERLDRLPVDARRTLQVAAVIGNRGPRTWLERIVGATIDGPLKQLDESGLAQATAEEVEVVHPFVREVVLATIPAEARRQWHASTLELLIEKGGPIELRADHAYQAAEYVTALVLLEGAGAAAARRGDPESAIHFYRRGVELARKQTLRADDTAFEGALLSFSRRLGYALMTAGDGAGADGVLREALDWLGPVSKERAAMLHLLGRVSAQRGRIRQAATLLHQALELALNQENVAEQAEVYASLARIREQEGNIAAAATSAGKALELLGLGTSSTDEDASVSEQTIRRTQVGIIQARLLQKLRRTSEARRVLEDVLAASEGQVFAVRAQALGELAELDNKGPLKGKADEYLAAAAETAAQAGDADGHARWSTRLNARLRGTPTS